MKSGKDAKIKAYWTPLYGVSAKAVLNRTGGWNEKAKETADHVAGGV